MPRTTSPRFPHPLPASVITPLRTRSTDWHDQVAALKSLTSLSLEIPPSDPALLRQLRELSHPFSLLIHSLRSTLVKEACAAISSLSQHLGPPFVQAVASDVVPALLKRSCATKSVVSNSALETARALFDNGVVGLPISVAKILTGSVKDKKLPVLTRRAAALFVGMMLIEDCLEGLGSMATAVEEAIISGCQDSNEKVRAISRENWRKVDSLDNAFAREMLPRLGSTVATLLVKEGGSGAAEATADWGESRISPKSAGRREIGRSAQRVAVSGRGDGGLGLKELSPTEKRKELPAKRNGDLVRKTGPYRVAPAGNGNGAERGTAVRRVGLPPRLERKEAKATGAVASTRKVKTIVRLPRRSVAPGMTAGLKGGLLSLSTEEDGSKGKAEKGGNGKTFEEDKQRKIEESDKEKKIEKSESKIEISKKPREILVVEQVKGNGDAENVGGASSPGSLVTSNSDPDYAEPSGDVAAEDLASTAPADLRVGAQGDSEKKDKSEGKNSEAVIEASRKARLSFLLNMSTPENKSQQSPFPNTDTSGNSDTQGTTKHVAQSDVQVPSAEEEQPEEAHLKPAENNVVEVVPPVNRPSPQDVALLMSLTSLRDMDNDKERSPSAPSNHVTDISFPPPASGDPLVLAMGIAPDSKTALFEDLRTEPDFSPVIPEMRSWDVLLADIERDIVVSRKPEPIARSVESNAEGENGRGDDGEEEEENGKENLRPGLSGMEPSASSDKPLGALKRTDQSRALKADVKVTATEKVVAGRPRGRGPRRSVMPGTRIQFDGDVTRKASEVARGGVNRQLRGPRRSIMPVSAVRLDANDGAEQNRKGTSAAAKTASGNARSVKVRNSNRVTAGIAKARTVPRRSVVPGSVVPVRVREGGGVASGGSKRKVSKALQGLIEWLKRCMRLKRSGWQEKVQGLGGFGEACKMLSGERMGPRLAEDCVGMLGGYIAENHYRVVRAGLDGLFFLLLCCEESSHVLRKGLEKHEGVLKKVLGLMIGGKEDVRLAAQRVLQGFEVQFTPEVRVELVMKVLESVGDGVVEGRVGEVGCRVMTGSLTSGEGFVWTKELLEVVLKGLERMKGDRRAVVRKGVEKVVEAVKGSLPERAFELACEKYKVDFGQWVSSSNVAVV